MIALRNVRAEVDGGKEVLSSLSLDLEKGQVLGVYGPNGSGKSTLLRAIAGVSKGRTVNGEIRVNDVEIVPALLARDRVRKIVYLGSDFETPFELKVRELFELGAEVMGRSHGDQSEVIERLALNEFLNRDFRSLSDGEKQFTMFARALIQKPEVLIFDETFSKLDLDKLILVAKTIRAYAASGLTVIIASHDLNFLTESADELLFLKLGKKVAAGSVSDTLTAATLETLYPELALHVVVSPETGRYKVLY
jgi:iron complex transport system ATP-binding protein